MRHPRITAILAVSAGLLAAPPFLAAQAPKTKGQATRPAAAPAKTQAATAPAKTQAAPKPADPAAEAELERILKAWEVQSSQIKTLSAVIDRTDFFQIADDTKRFVGQAELMAPDLAYLNFQEVDEKGKPAPITERIVCNGKEVWLFTAETKQINIFPLAENQRQKTMEEGPLPFLFNFKAAEAKSRYLIQLGPSQSPRYYVILITPRFPADQQGFSKAMIALSKTRFLPEQIRLWKPNDKDIENYVFSDKNLKVNVPIDKEKFQPRPFKGWKVERFQANNGPINQPGNAAGLPPRAGAASKVGQAQPATKGGGRVGR